MLVAVSWFACVGVGYVIRDEQPELLVGFMYDYYSAHITEYMLNVPAQYTSN